MMTHTSNLATHDFTHIKGQFYLDQGMASEQELKGSRQAIDQHTGRATGSGTVPLEQAGIEIGNTVGGFAGQGDTPSSGTWLCHEAFPFGDRCLILDPCLRREQVILYKNTAYRSPP